MRDTYHPLFDKYNIDLLLQTHNHNYQHSYSIIYNNDKYYHPQGIIFNTVGTSGAEAYPLTEQASYIVTQYVGFGFLNIDIMNNRETLSRIFYVNDGTIKDHFTITKFYLLKIKKRFKFTECRMIVIPSKT